MPNEEDLGVVDGTRRTQKKITINRQINRIEWNFDQTWELRLKLRWNMMESGPLCLLAMDSSALNHHSSGDSGRTQPFTAETRTLMAGNFHQLPAKELGISRTQGVGCMNLAFYEVA